MTNTNKLVRWANLDKQGKAKQFTERGHERVARSEVRSNCVICADVIPSGGSYFDVNGAKFAHKTCVIAGSSERTKHSKVITHKMIEAVSAQKAASASTRTNSKRGRKPKSLTLHKAGSATSVTAVKASKRGRKPKSMAIHQTPTINLSDVREALPGAIVTLTITGPVEAVQRALDKLQN